MNFSKKTFVIFFPWVLILTVLAFSLRIFVLWNTIDPETGFFTASSLPCTIYNALAFLVLVVSLAAGSILSRREMKRRETDSDLPPEDAKLPDADKLTTPEILIRSAGNAEEDKNTNDDTRLIGFAKNAVTWNGTFSAFSQFFLAALFLLSALFMIPFNESKPEADIFILSVLSCLCAAYFLLAAIANTSKKNPFLYFLSLFPSIYAAMRLVVEYRDLMKYINKSLYIGQFFFVITTLIFFLYQAQTALGVSSFYRPNLYAFSVFPLVFFGVSSQLPKLLWLLADRASVGIEDIALLLVDFGITLYAVVKMLAFLRFRQKK